MAKDKLTIQGIKEGGLLTLGIGLIGVGAPMLADESARVFGFGLVAMGTIAILAMEIINST